MLRKALLVPIALLVLATPAVAGGFRSTLGPTRTERAFGGVPQGFVAAPPGFVAAPQGFTAPRGIVLPHPLPLQLSSPGQIVTSRDGSPFPPQHVDRFDRDFRHRPIIVVAPPPTVVIVEQYGYPATAYAAPRQCESPGYWAYRQVPFTSTQNVWVEGSWGSDGRWIDSHWELRPYSSSYNEPYWVPGQTYDC